MTATGQPGNGHSPDDTGAVTHASRSAALISLSVPAGFGLYLLLTSTRPLIAGIWPYDAKRMLEFVLLLLLFLLPALNHRIRQQFGNQIRAVPPWLLLALTGVVAWGVVSALVNARSLMHALNSLSEVALLASLALGVFVVAACRSIAGRWFDRIAIGLLALTGLTVGVQELIGVFAAHAGGVQFNFRVSLMHFSWPRFYNQVQSWMVPALVALPLLFSRQRLAYWLCLLVLGLQWYIILMTAARGSFVSILAAVTAAAVFLPAARITLLKWQAGGLVLGALIFAAVWYSFMPADPAPPETSRTSAITAPAGQAKQAPQGEVGGTFYEKSIGRQMAHTSGRTWMWRHALADTAANPLFGIGPMNYACTSPKRIGHPHNFPLQLSAEWGIPAALAACFIAAFLIVRSARAIRNGVLASGDDTRLGSLLLTGIVAAGLHACLSGIMVMPASQVTGLLLCGMLLGLFPGRPGMEPGKAANWLFIPGLLLSLGLLILGTHELRTLQPRAEALKAGESMWPRVWQDSKVCRFYTMQIQVNN